ncbi:unnamed protein product [Protopolystoma xenopodis]|uniref:RNase NYN domain-containing protein n=1 Tax=Protopolystoma xenopodis TaxID=117903 RepID=A0A448XAE7_9PLAT|nr:unnamed protein product [Protopolystoma xenopodis]
MNNLGFSVEGIRLAVEYFKKRGHDDISIVIPRHWQSQGGVLFKEYERRGYMVYTPSRCVNGERQCAYDDRVILQLASRTRAVVISNDQYRDLIEENPAFRDVIENRIIVS